MWSFLGVLSGNVPVFCAIWYDSGYALRQFTVSVWQQRQVRTVQTVPGFGFCPFTPFPDEEVAALVVFNCGMAGCAWVDAPRAALAFLAVFCSLVGRPKIFGIVFDVDRKPCTSP